MPQCIAAMLMLFAMPFNIAATCIAVILKRIASMLLLLHHCGNVAIGRGIAAMSFGIAATPQYFPDDSIALLPTWALHLLLLAESDILSLLGRLHHWWTSTGGERWTYLLFLERYGDKWFFGVNCFKVLVPFGIVRWWVLICEFPECIPLCESLVYTFLTVTHDCLTLPPA